ncbi:hypothetical protein KAOT1_08208 [Kordia algicida OT-1]|uniref:Uncharacterized protein n=1 Tax=Kordia algicida OT-1 TaxID=391587 RepID=A9DYI5_9FLAO|nr:hypothetical protein KAOT1_08208 [Kordia algicida OT-1]
MSVVYVFTTQTKDAGENHAYTERGSYLFININSLNHEEN